MIMMRMLLILVAVGTTPNSAFAWGASGHSIVAELAQRRLTDAAATAVEKLIGRASLASIASWADDYKFVFGGAKTKRWHYVDIDTKAGSYSAATDCQLEEEGDCIVKALEREMKLLANSAMPLIDRQNALRFVVHLTGDLSQPFHCAEHEKDGGGNAVKVEFAGKGPDGKELKRSTNLHALWDETLIEAHAFSWGAYLDEIATTIAPAVGEPLAIEPDVMDWANMCFAAGKQAYGLLPVGWEATVAAGNPVALDAAYQSRAQPLLDQQLAIGGLHLARALNYALSEGK